MINEDKKEIMDCRVVCALSDSSGWHRSNVRTPSYGLGSLTLTRRPTENPPRNDEQSICHAELVSGSHNFTPSPLVGEGRGEGLKQQTLSRICKLAFGSLTNSTPVLKLLHAHRVSPKLLRNRRLNLFAIRINSLSLNHPSAIPLSQRERVKWQFAFTLAEVLITLGIIGVVAAMTMPSLIQKHQERVTANKVKKFYSVMSQAQLLAIKDNGYVDEWDVPAEPNGMNIESITAFMNYMKPYLKIAKDCGGDRCFKTDYVVYCLNGSRYGIPDHYLDMYKLILIDGSYMWLRGSNHEHCKGCDGGRCGDVCANLAYDINGDRPPNIVGRDIFTFYFTKNALFADVSNDCNLNNKGWGCSSWILEKGNMDYLKK